jgi:hypothetical protein
MPTAACDGGDQAHYDGAMDSTAPPQRPVILVADDELLLREVLAETSYCCARSSPSCWGTKPGSHPARPAPAHAGGRPYDVCQADLGSGGAEIRAGSRRGKRPAASCRSCGVRTTCHAVARVPGPIWGPVLVCPAPPPPAPRPLVSPPSRDRGTTARKRWPGTVNRPWRAVPASPWAECRVAPEARRSFPSPSGRPARSG